jgi:hypothetical protein
VKLRAQIDFWGDGVTCFCPEAVGRLLHEAFSDVSIDPSDLAYEKYRHVADKPRLERSAWFEFLRSGPRHAFTLSSGVKGVFSRYEIVFELPLTLDEMDVARIRGFLEGLGSRAIEVE